MKDKKAELGRKISLLGPGGSSPGPDGAMILSAGLTESEKMVYTDFRHFTGRPASPRRTGLIDGAAINRPNLHFCEDRKGNDAPPLSGTKFELFPEYAFVFG